MDNKLNLTFEEPKEPGEENGAEVEEEFKQFMTSMTQEPAFVDAFSNL